MTEHVQAPDAPSTPRPRRGNPEALEKARAAKAAKRAERADADERAGVRAASGPPSAPEETPRARPSREMQEARERRQRLDVMDGSEDYSLIVTVELDQNYVHRWELDEPGVLERRYTNQWERAEEQEPYHAYTDGLRPVNYVLIRKWRDWYVEDQEPRKARDRSVMEQILSGQALESFGHHEDGRSAQYTRDSRGRDIEISLRTDRSPR